MSNDQKKYFLCPTWDYSPLGPVQLGNIIISPTEPAEALNGPNCPRPPPDRVHPATTQSDVVWSFDKSHAHRFGWSTEVLSGLLGAGINFGVDRATSAKYEFHFKELETTEFTPTEAFLQQCLAESPEATEFLARSRLRHHLYIVTAIKVARGASARTTTSSERGVEATIRLDGTPLGVPVNLGPEVSVSRGRAEGASFGESSEIVFAYRLRRFCLKKKGEVVEHEQYNKGAMFGEDSGGTRSRELPFVVVGSEEVLAEEDGSIVVVGEEKEPVRVQVRALS